MSKILLDTNIIIHREASKVINTDIGILFNWIDKLKYLKYIHPLTVEELNRNQDARTVETMNIKISSYNLIKNPAPTSDILEAVSKQVDTTPNDRNDTLILNEILCDRVDILISEDKKIYTKAALLGISDKVYKIEQFLEKVVAENPDLVDYKVLAVKKVDFAQVDLQNAFFDSFREDYNGFDKWFNKKADETAYICYSNNELSAFLYVKVEDENENYADITPNFSRKKRLKIGTFKVTSNGFRIGERFLKIIFDNALQYRISEIYVTIFDKRPEQQRLIALLEEWGFYYFGNKTTPTGEEKVYVKDFDRNQLINSELPKKSFPFSSKLSKVYIVPIYPAYHTELFPDSILRTESSKDFIENEPHRNALSKVYISRSLYKDLKTGDLIVFYRTGESGNAIHTGVATTIGIVESVIDNIPNEEAFVKLCRKRSVFTDDELKKHWNYRKTSKPFIVNFLYTHSLKKRPNLKWLNDNGIIPNILDMPRGFREITRENFNQILKYSTGK
ncbi:MAG: PIN domain-containing protein [Chitinophagaceae bacterium]